MRHLKFRAWDTDNKMFIDPANHTLSQLNNDYAGLGNRYTYQQFIGLLDKNKVEIYNGDIVGVNYKGKDFTGEVKWNQQSASFIFINKKRYLEIISMAAYGDGEIMVLDGVEVIGNVFENPELLTVEADLSNFKN